MKNIKHVYKFLMIFGLLGLSNLIKPAVSESSKLEQVMQSAYAKISSMDAVDCSLIVLEGILAACLIRLYLISYGYCKPLTYFDSYTYYTYHLPGNNEVGGFGEETITNDSQSEPVMLNEEVVLTRACAPEKQPEILVQVQAPEVEVPMVYPRDTMLQDETDFSNWTV
jgi:hypothetical protein